MFPVCRRRSSGAGEAPDEGRPAAGLALDSDDAVVGVHYALGDMESKTESGTTARTPIDPLEGVKDPLTMFGRDTRAVVLHHDLHRAVGTARRK